MAARGDRCGERGGDFASALFVSPEGARARDGKRRACGERAGDFGGDEADDVLLNEVTGDVGRVESGAVVLMACDNACARRRCCGICGNVFGARDDAVSSLLS